MTIPDDTLPDAIDRLDRAYMRWAFHRQWAMTAELLGNQEQADRIREEAEHRLQEAIGGPKPMDTATETGHAPRTPRSEQFSRLAHLLGEALEYAAACGIPLPSPLDSCRSYVVQEANTWWKLERHAPLCPSCGDRMEPVTIGPQGFQAGRPDPRSTLPQMYRCQNPDPAYHAGAPIVLPGTTPANGESNGPGSTGRSPAPGGHGHRPGGPAIACRPPAHQQAGADSEPRDRATRIGTEPF